MQTHTDGERAQESKLQRGRHHIDGSPVALTREFNGEARDKRAHKEGQQQDRHQQRCAPPRLSEIAAEGGRIAGDVADHKPAGQQRHHIHIPSHPRQRNRQSSLQDE